MERRSALRRCAGGSVMNGKARGWTLLVLGFALMMTLVPLASAQAPRKGGVLHVGILGEPPTLDAHWSTTALVETRTNHTYEGLDTRDPPNRPIPIAAE